MLLKTELMTMGDAEKPFACNFHGCGMKFVLEDHLTQHQRKHELSLSLSGFATCKSSYLDQTPTPTRFIKNCDALGLFQDLQHLNPFDEEFRKASHSGCPPQSGDRSLDSEDSLNTPNVIPLTTERQVVPPDPEVQELVFPSDEEMPESQTFPIAVVTHKKDCELTKETEQSPVKESLSQPTSVITHSTNIASVPLLPNKTVSGSIAPVSVVVGSRSNILTAAPNRVPTTIPIVTTIKTEAVQQVSSVAPPVTLIIKLDGGQVPYVPTLAPQPAGPTISKLALENAISQVPATVKLKAAINNRVSKVSASPSTTSLNNKNLAVVQPTLQTALPGRRRQEDEENPDEKRLKFLERNRAAAARCRTRKKQWVVSLQRKADELASTNELLQREVALLRNEVAKLKTMLLAHKDCPVTQQQRAAGNNNVFSMGEQTLCPPLTMSENSHSDALSIGMQSYCPNLSMSSRTFENGTIFVDTIEVEVSSSDSSCDGKSLPGSSE